MTFYRIKQFYMAITSKITDEDYKLINKYLNEKEINIFNKLSKSEKAHSIRVAKDVEKISYNNKISNYSLVKAALLHDIGKIKVSLNVIEKSLLVILNRILKDKIKKSCSINKINNYYNHGEIGADILKKIGSHERLIYMVKNHHNNDIIDDMELNILKKCDSTN